MGEGPAPDRRVRVLVADDEAEIRELCRVNLEFAGFEVLEASDGLQALDRVARDHPDFVFLDLMMPGADGWEVLARLRSDPATRDLPVVLLTAHSTDEEQIRAWETGIFDYIVKPFNPLGLAEWVHQALEDPDPDFAERRRQQVLDQLRFLRDMR